MKNCCLTREKAEGTAAALLPAALIELSRVRGRTMIILDYEEDGGSISSLR